jgi:hypothetical protein
MHSHRVVTELAQPADSLLDKTSPNATALIAHQHGDLFDVDRTRHANGRDDPDEPDGRPVGECLDDP